MGDPPGWEGGTAGAAVGGVVGPDDKPSVVVTEVKPEKETSG